LGQIAAAFQNLSNHFKILIVAETEAGVAAGVGGCAAQTGMNVCGEM